jgi:hypothetical protein
VSNALLTGTQTTYTRVRLLKLLEKLEASESPGITFYFPPGLNEKNVEKELSAFPEITDIPASVRQSILKSDTGGVLFWGLDQKYLVLPPFPVGQKVVMSGYDTTTLAGIIKKDYIVALIVIRMGIYGIGIFEGEKMLDSKVGTGLVHGRHKKGGSSQRRYERHRDKQVEYFFNRVCGHVREKLESRLKSIQILYFGGEIHTVKLFTEYCDFLKPLMDRRSDVLLNVREPRQKALADAIHIVYSSRVIEIAETGDKLPPS